MFQLRDIDIRTAKELAAQIRMVVRSGEASSLCGLMLEIALCVLAKKSCLI